ncbi:MAG: YbhB/YbcL family Raf kinase inhibitor-like protein [Anaerolineae bacterium]
MARMKLSPWMRSALTVVGVLGVLALACACQGRGELTPEPTMVGAAPSDLMLTSSAFAEGDAIPARYTCDGEDVSPPLSWEGPPDGTERFALICDDPDAPGGTWVHWVVYDLPGDARTLPEAVPADPVLDSGARQGLNSWSRTGYGGPCPPRGVHRYVFKLYALDATLALAPEETDKAALLGAMEGHVLAQTTLIGTYTRQD